jgi:predicted nucleic acid-binding protein
LTFDLRRALRRIKPHRLTQPIRRRSKAELPFVSALTTSGRGLLLDTCVYIDIMQHRVPSEVAALLRLRTNSHLSVCVAELTHSFGRLDPLHPGTAAVLQIVERAISAIPPHRLQTASESVVIEAGILAGLVFRLCNLQAGQEVAALNDAILYLHAMETGQAVLTRNRHGFDTMQQILPDGQMLLYDPIA